MTTASVALRMPTSALSALDLGQGLFSLSHSMTS